MGLSGWLVARAVRATRVIVVECPGGWRTRVAVEREAAARGWRLADSAASADLLVVVGDPVGEVTEVVDRLWDAMPGPRARAAVGVGADVAPTLDEAVTRLLDGPEQVQDAAGRTEPDLASGGMDHGGMDHSGHEGMDHGDMEMAPAGIPLAEGSEDDRDGLEMDALPVRLGPVLPHWPAGLVLDVTLHGDLVVSADARLLRGTAGQDDDVLDPAARAARHCDDVVAVLALANWVRGEVLARSARDTLLDRRGGDARAALLDLRHHAERSRPLRWALGGVGLVPSGLAGELGLDGGVVGDCHDRLLGLIDRAAAAARGYGGLGTEAGAGEVPEGDAPVLVPVEALGELVTGHDLAVARLLVATLGTLRTPAEVTTGG